MKYKKTIAYLLSTIVLFVSLLSWHYYQRYQELQTYILTDTGTEALQQLTYSEREYKRARSQIASIVQLITHSKDVSTFATDPTLFNQHELEVTFSHIASNLKWFDAMSYVDTSGKELVRIDYNFQSNLPKVHSAAEDHSSRDYFKFAQELDNNEIATWGVAVEKPQASFNNNGTGLNGNSPVVDDNSPKLIVISPVTLSTHRYGYLAVSLDIRFLLSNLNLSFEDHAHPQLLDPNGSFLSIDSTRDVAHIDLSDDQPATWKYMQDKESGFTLEGELFTVFKRFNSKLGECLYLVVQFTHDDMVKRAYRDFNDLYQEAIFVLLITLVFALPTTSAVLYYRRRSVESQLARAALNGMSAVMISDRRHRVVMVNQEFTRLTGYQQKEIQGNSSINTLLSGSEFEKVFTLLDDISHDDLWEGELAIRNLNDSLVTAIVRIQAIRSKYGDISYYITSLVDITERKALEERLRTLSERDVLTNLWNRRKFESELLAITKLVERYPEKNHACLALIDIDHFKRINDERGHDVGDRVIKEMGEFLLETLRETDFCSRIGGEEYAVVMPHTTLEEADLALNRLRVSLELAPNLPVTISIGYTDIHGDSKRCYKWADIALYEAKSLGRNRVALCQSSDEIA